MTQKINRREVLITTAAVGTGYWLGASTRRSRAADSPNEKLNLAIIGIGGRGSANLKGVSSQNIVALCDVDDERAGGAYEKFPKAKKFYDYRKMLAEVENEIDAVVISTPDHTHFHPAMMTLDMGKHLYCEKPMAHNVWEVRTMTNLAKQQGVATQLGVQRHTLPSVHRSVELIQSGAIGTVVEVHSWVGGDRGMPSIPADKEAVPAHVKWDLWLGPTEAHDFHETYCPYGWRFWWDFGTGEMGNWGCHILDIPFWALKLGYPTRVDAEGPEIDSSRTPKSMSTHFEFPARDGRPALKLHWHHTKTGPAILKEKGIDAGGHNTLFLGSKGMLLCGFKGYQLLPTETFENYQLPEPLIPQGPGFYNEWIGACQGGKAATCNFDYSGPLAETVLLGNAAYRSGAGFDWDSANLKTVGNDAAAKYIREEYRQGWQSQWG